MRPRRSLKALRRSRGDLRRRGGYGIRDCWSKLSLRFRSGRLGRWGRGWRGGIGPSTRREWRLRFRRSRGGRQCGRGHRGTRRWRRLRFRFRLSRRGRWRGRIRPSQRTGHLTKWWMRWCQRRRRHRTGDLDDLDVDRVRAGWRVWSFQQSHEAEERHERQEKCDRGQPRQPWPGIIAESDRVHHPIVA